ncbi:hypothetical protein BD413DRAFT_538066, partial [Trametes elegans]
MPKLACDPSLWRRRAGTRRRPLMGRHPRPPPLLGCVSVRSHLRRLTWVTTERTSHAVYDS